MKLWLWAPARAALGPDDGSSFRRPLSNPSFLGRRLPGHRLLDRNLLDWILGLLSRPWPLANRRALRRRQGRSRPAGQLLRIVEQPRRQFPIGIDGDDLPGLA